MGDLDGKTYIVTGSASGIGAATAECILQKGGNIVATDIHWPIGRAASDLDDPERALVLTLDVGSAKAWAEVVESSLNTFSRIDGLVNNAGRYIVKPLEDTSLDEWKKLTDTNTKGVFLGCRAVHPAMKKVGGGSIVNVISAAGAQYFQGMAAYSASKAAVVSFTRAAMIDYAKDQIRVNGVMPGTVRTGMTGALLQMPEFVETVVGKHAMKRAAEPSEIAEVVTFLLSDEASYVNGMNVLADGGLTIT